VRILALTTAYAAALRAGEWPLGYRDFPGVPDAASAAQYGQRLLEGQHHPEVAREESVAYLGHGFLEWVATSGEAAAWQRWHAQGRRGFLPVRFFRYVLQQMQPDVLVTTNSPRSEQAAIEAAVALGIPCLSMVDLFALSGDAMLARTVHADRITVLAEGTRDNLVRAGVPAGRIVVTGNPAFDAFCGPDAPRAGAQWLHAKGWEGLSVVLWAGHRESVDLAGRDARWAGTGLGRAVQDELVAWAATRPDVALAVRYHPNECHDFPRLPLHPRIHWSQPGEEALLPVLMAADQVVVQITTVGAQAHAAGKRVLSLRYSPAVRETGMDYAALGMATGVDGPTDLVPTLELGLQTQRDDHKLVAAPLPAAPRVAAEIAALVRSKEAIQ
jgi:hypothetical protein